MKLKFRRNKAPLRIPEKGDKNIHRHKGWQALSESEIQIKTASKLIPVQADIQPICPFCKHPVTKENTHEMFLNGRRMQVHKICPK